MVDACPSASDASIPTSILQCKRSCWVATHDYININGQKILSSYGEALEGIKAGTVITMILTFDGILSKFSIIIYFYFYYCLFMKSHILLL